MKKYPENPDQSKKNSYVATNAFEFDQGAIWTGSVIEHQGMLYVYYEGWGSYKNDGETRNKPYYAGGNSRVGIASCSPRDVLKWVDE